MDITPRSRTAYLPILFSIVLIAGILLGIGLSRYPSGQSFRKEKGLSSRFNDILNFVQENYVDTVNKDKLFESAVNGMLQSLDPHSQYIPASEFHEVTDPLKGNFEGIGVQFRIVKDTVVVISPVPGGPSEKVGIRAGDRIVNIDGKKVAGVKISDRDVMKKLKGQKGTKVKVDVRRKGYQSLLPFSITRDVIPTYCVDAAYLATNDIGYIKISKFSATLQEEFSKALQNLSSEGMKKLIIDLRGNSGGYLQAAIDLADHFLPDKAMIVYTQGNRRPKQVYSATGKGLFEKGELVVLIDEGSASSSEIFAGAIQDNDRGTIIGRRSFGKGLVQEQLDMSDGSAVRLTVARYFTPTGRSIQKSYKNGVDDYNHEYMQRFTDGEVEHPDSIHFPDSLKFTTPKGKIVYGGGGIMPDIYIPLEKADENKYYNKLINSGVIYQFAFDYTDKERSKLSKYSDYHVFDKQFQVSNELLQELFVYAVRNKIPTEDKEIRDKKEELKNLLKALIARNIFDDKGFYPLYNKDDKTYKRALEILQK